MMRPRYSHVLLLVLACCIALSLFTFGQYLQMRDELAQTRARLAHIETAVKKREEADPLQAEECVELELGDSADKPCLTTLRRLAMAPQQYHGRWVVVEGLYAGGFELSALFPDQENRLVMAPGLDRHAALWVQLGLPDTPKEMPLIYVTGKFKRGPAGHMREYFGELLDAKVSGRSSGAKR